MKAFPRPNTVHPDDLGMDLRDYFASKIIVALIPSNQSPEMIPYVCEAAYKWADAMMEVRNGK
jgi:hypothetical protein